MHTHKKFIAIALCFFALFSCQSAQKDPNSSRKDAPESLEITPPITANSLPHVTETIAILGTNDIHGTLAPLHLKTRASTRSPSISYQAGGVATLASYVNILREEFGEHLLWLDAGDEFQGAIESNLQLGAPMVQFFNQNRLNAAAVGNHEFDFGLDTLKQRMSEAKYPYLAANIREKATGKPASFPNSLPHTLFSAGKLKVGVIGLSTLETPISTRAENVKTLDFEDLKIATLRESYNLREKGAHIVVITAHSGLKCSAGRIPPSRLIRKPADPQGECGNQDEIVHLLQSLPAGTIDAVIAGHTHQIVHHWIAGVPVIQAGAFGRYFNVIYLTYDWNLKQVLADQTRIEGPVPVCPQVFQNQNDCNGDRPEPKNGRGSLVSHKFHGKMIKPDSGTVSLLAPVLKKAEAEKSRLIGIAALPISHFPSKESPLGNLVADAMRNAVHTDFALINPGGIRDSLNSGPILFGDIFRIFPFDNSISILQVTGKELYTLLRVSQNGHRGFSSVSGLSLTLIDPKQDAPWDDLNGDGKDAAWKTNRLLKVTLSNGDALDYEKFYTLATSDFLVTGGDDLGWAMAQIPANRIQHHSKVLIRDAIVQYIQRINSINNEAHPLIDPIHPRLKFETIPKNNLKNKKYGLHKRHRKKRK